MIKIKFITIAGISAALLASCIDYQNPFRVNYTVANLVYAGANSVNYNSTLVIPKSSITNNAAGVVKDDAKATIVVNGLDTSHHKYAYYTVDDQDNASYAFVQNGSSFNTNLISLENDTNNYQLGRFVECPIDATSASTCAFALVNAGAVTQGKATVIVGPVSATYKFA